MSRLRVQSARAIAASELPTLTLRSTGTVAGLALEGRLNRCIGWLLMAGAFLSALWWDTELFRSADQIISLNDRTIFLRHAQTMLLELGLLQLTVGEIIAEPSASLSFRCRAAFVTALGALISTCGYIIAAYWPGGLELIVIGSLINAGAFLAIALAKSSGRSDGQLRLLLLIVCLGTLLEASATLLDLMPRWFSLSYIGPPDGIRLRLLRLARVAAVALPVLAILYRGLSFQSDARHGVSRVGSFAILCGALGMPAVLAAAGLTYVELKALLPIPSLAIFAGTVCGAWLAKKSAHPAEFCGWLLIALSMGAGMVMGLYAFVAPASAPNALADYNNDLRRLIRLVHTYAILFGFMHIFAARQLSKSSASTRRQVLAVRLLTAGSVATIVALLLGTIFDVTPELLGVGPALAAFASLIFVGCQKTIAPPKFAVCDRGRLGGRS